MDIIGRWCPDELHRNIDPGGKGALAIIKCSDDLIEDILVCSFDERIYADELKKLYNQPSICCLERVNAMPKQGVVSMFNFGKNFGFIQGLLTAYSIPYELVTPQKWKKEFQITGDKNSSIAVCKRLFPDVDLRRTERCRKDDDGAAESLLLAEYARRKL